MKKFAFIGAGSLQFTSSCVRDLLTFPAFTECELALMDIDENNLADIKKVVENIEKNKRHTPYQEYFGIIAGFGRIQEKAGYNFSSKNRFIR